MRVAIVTESFPPDVNGVANSVLRVAEHCVARGHEPLVVAPQPAARRRPGARPLPYPVRAGAVGGAARLPRLPARPAGPARSPHALRDHGADVVHLASPFVLGAWGAAAARSSSLPVVAVYQTDVPGLRPARTGWADASSTAWRWLRRIHGRAARTLAPSTSTAAELLAHGVRDVWLWRRGVDSDPASTRAAATRRSGAALAPDGEVLVGYVGRLAVGEAGRPARRDRPAARACGWWWSATGRPARALERRCPAPSSSVSATAPQLARLYASLDVFVHTGPFETFCQAVQEAMASGVPVVAPAAGGPLDLVQPGRTGYPGAAAATAARSRAAVAELAADPGVRRAYGTAARAAVAGRTWDGGRR